MISEFPFNQTQLRRASYKLSDALGKAFDSVENTDRLESDLTTIAAHPQLLLTNESQMASHISYMNPNNSHAQNILTLFRVLDMPDEKFVEFMQDRTLLESITGFATRPIADFMVDSYFKQASETTDQPEEQLRNIKLAFRFVQYAHTVLNIPNAFLGSEEEKMFSIFNALVISHFKSRYDRQYSILLSANIIYAAMQIDNLSYRIANEIWNFTRADDFTLTDEDLQMLSAFDNPKNIIESVDNSIKPTVLTFYGIPISWFSEAAQIKLENAILMAAYPNLESKELLITQPAFKAYTLAQVIDGPFNYAIDAQNKALDFENLDNKITLTYGDETYVFDSDLSKEDFEEQLSLILTT